MTRPRLLCSTVTSVPFENRLACRTLGGRLERVCATALIIGGSHDSRSPDGAFEGCLALPPYANRRDDVAEGGSVASPGGRCLCDVPGRPLPPRSTTRATALKTQFRGPPKGAFERSAILHRQEQCDCLTAAAMSQAATRRRGSSRLRFERAGSRRSVLGLRLAARPLLTAYQRAPRVWPYSRILFAWAHRLVRRRTLAAFGLSAGVLAVGPVQPAYSFPVRLAARPRS